MLIVVLSPHTWLILAIFVPYMIMMGGLFIYICWTGYHREKDGSDEDDRDRAEMRLAA